jgi:hypothetical protein
MTKQALIINRINELSEPELDRVNRFIDCGCPEKIDPKALTLNGFTVAEEDAIIKASEEADKGVNVSPAFDNMDDAIKWLNDPKYPLLDDTVNVL